MTTKSIIYITTSDNESFFDGKLSKKELSENSILRIVRDIRYVGEEKTGVISRRKQLPLEVIELDNKWHINGAIEKSENIDKPEKVAILNQKKITKGKNKKKLSSWDKLTQHERNLITCVKYDIHDDFDKNEELAKKEFNKNGIKATLSGIQMFKPGNIYFLNEEEYRITDNNGKYLYFSFRGVPEKVKLETDLIGEYFRPLKNRMEIIHSEDYKKNKEKSETRY